MTQELVQNPIYTIVGPTASGKSSLSIALAKAIDAEIVNADSMQIYRGMDIGTAKVPPEQRCVKHYGIDIADPGDPFSAALFQDYARDAFEKIWASDKNVILSGGTGFYIRAAIDDYSFAKGEQVGNEVRDKYSALLADIESEGLWKLLQEKDPRSAEVIHVNDTKRVIRAFELLDQGLCYKDQLDKLSEIKQKYPVAFFGIKVDRDILAKRIDDRVDEMREAGLVEEVEELLSKGYRSAVTANQAIGYKEIVAAIDGEIDLDEAFEKIKTGTRRYAKRQRTWFRKDKRIHWIDGDSGNIEAMLEQILATEVSLKG